MKISELEYQPINFKETTKIFKSLMKEFKNAQSGLEQLEVDKKFYQMYEEIFTTSTLVMIRYNQNTKDEFYQKEYKSNNKKLMRFQLKMLKYGKMLLKSKYRDVLEQHIPKHVFVNFANMEKIYNKKIVFISIKESLLKMAYTKLMSNLVFDYDGKKMTPSTIIKYFHNSDREVRKSAYEAFGKALESIAPQLDRLYEKLVKLRDKKAKRLGFPSHTDVSYLELSRHGYSKEDIARFRENVKKHIVPLCTEIKQKVKSDFNLDKMMIYDEEIYTKEEPSPIGNEAEIMEKGLKMYQEMSQETGELYKLMLESECFDVISREGKRGGGFCTALLKYEMPFILANFNGSSGDLNVLTHEFGHALAAKKVFDIKMHHGRRYTSEIAEVHSMSMEFFTYKWMELFFGDKVEEYKFSHIAKAITFLPYGTIVDYFQEIVYDNPLLTPTERNQIWLKIEKEFLPHMSNDGIPAYKDGRRWQRQMHIYSYPFYYIDYCLAQITAFQFFDLIQKDYDSAFSIYMEFVNQAGTKTFPELIKSAGLNSPFEEQTFIDIVKVVRKNLNL